MICILNYASICDVYLNTFYQLKKRYCKYKDDFR